MQITFLLNDETISIEAPPALLALDFLRKHRFLTGSKEGCKEGDCGACAVIVGELVGDKVKYRPMTSCLLPMGELHGKHLVSIEGLNMPQLSPVQSAIESCGGTQCGYCTPGFVVAMTAGLMDHSVPLNAEGGRFAISGNLCRCTGYHSIRQASAKAIGELKPLLNSESRIESLCKAKALPPSFLQAPAKLKRIAANAPTDNQENRPNAILIAGGTDLFVQQGESLPESEVKLLNISSPSSRASNIRAARESGQSIILDARMSFEDFARDPLVRKAIPEIDSYNERIASWLIRTRASLAGNICNASPIADLTALLLVLEAQLVLSDLETTRTISLKELYLGYKKLAKKPNEVIEEITFPKPSQRTKINWEKVSKRRILDIASVNAAAKIEVENDRITEAHFSLGGVAPYPLYLKKTSKYLRSSEISVSNIVKAAHCLQTEIAPISDVRGSAHYKRLLARQLFISHFTRLFPALIKEESVYAALR